MQEQLTQEQKAQKFDEWAKATKKDQFKQLLGQMGVAFTEHECMGAIQTGGTPIMVESGLTGDQIKWKDKEQKQYHCLLTLSPIFGDGGQIFFYFDSDHNYVTHRIYPLKP